MHRLVLKQSRCPPQGDPASRVVVHLKVTIPYTQTGFTYGQDFSVLIQCINSNLYQL